MILKQLFSLIFFNIDTSLNIEVRCMKSLRDLENILEQGTVSQILDKGLSYYFMQKTGNFWSFLNSIF